MDEHPMETMIAVLESYPDNPRYIAAALAHGFRFEAPDVNTSSVGFSRGSDDNSIRVGLLRVEGIGPGAAGEIVRQQPFSSIEDMRERCNSQKVKAPQIEALRAIGAFESIGISGDDDDLTQLKLLSMVLNTPRAFKGKKPSVPKRSRGQWEYLGLERGLNLTFGKTFCAKTFWIPEGANMTLKAAPNGKYQAYLLPVVDENGVQFDLQVNESKQVEVKLIKLLAKCHDAVLCVDGQVSLPFIRGGNTAFKVWGVVGAEEGNPQIWDVDNKAAKEIVRLAKVKREMRRG